jgi:hypothetical protein
MENIKRYKNGTLYSSIAKKFVNAEYVNCNKDVRVIDCATKTDVTDEVNFLAAVEYVKEHNLYGVSKVIINKTRGNT